MTILAPFVVPAIVYLVVLVVLLATKNSKGVGTSLIFFLLAMAIGYWSTTQSRSSTAGLGLLTLPVLGAVAGFLGLAFGRWTLGSPDASPRKMFGWVAFGLGALLIAFSVAEGFKKRARYAARDRGRAAFNAELYRNRELIAGELAKNPARERAYLDSSIRARLNDRAFLLAALHSDSISADVLDTLATLSDRAIVLEAVRNPAARSETLRRVYQSKEFPDYYFQALAGHANTPPEILRKLYADPGVISSLDVWLAGNPSTPRDVLIDIMRETPDEHVLDRLAQNPALDCAMLGHLRGALARLNRPEEDYSVTRVAERTRQAC